MIYSGKFRKYSYISDISIEKPKNTAILAFTYSMLYGDFSMNS
jgi:hypothetical protein